MFKKTTLKNGLRIVINPMPNSKVVTVIVLVKTGSRYESKMNNGISHFVEHMLFTGTKKRHSPLLISEPINSVGGILNGKTGKNITLYYITITSKYTSLALDLLSDMLLNSSFKTKDINKEKEIIIGEYNKSKDILYIQNNILWNKLLYGDQQAGRSTIGSIENIKKIDKKKLKKYFEKQYISKNIVVSIAGDMSYSIIKQVKKYFSNIRTSSKSTNRPKVIERQKKPQFLIYYKKTNQTYIFRCKRI